MTELHPLESENRKSLSSANSDKMSAASPKIDTFFIVYGLQVRIVGPESVVLNLKQDFSYFSAENAKSSSKPDLTIEIRQHKFIIKPEKFFKTKSYTVYGRSLQRYVEYSDGSKIIVTQNLIDGRLVSIMTANLARSYELTYLAMHSFIGEQLEKQNFLRLHALSFQYSNQNAMVFLPSGGGKSSLAALMLKSDEYKIFSDEVTLLNDKEVRAYPWRIGLDAVSANKLSVDTSDRRLSQRFDGRAKFLLQIPMNKVAKTSSFIVDFEFGEAEAATSAHVYWGVFSSAEAPGIRTATRNEKYRFFCSIVLGQGLMQMAEFIVRTDNFSQLFRTAIRRAFWALRQIKNLNVLVVNRDYDKVLSVLGDDLKSKPAHQPII